MSVASDAIRIPARLAAGIADRVADRVVNPGGRADPGELREAVEGQVILVTGASHGIGRAASEQLAAAGAEVLALARSEDELEELAAAVKDWRGVVHPTPGDVGKLDSIPELCASIIERHGTPDVVVNNAGKSIRRSVELSYDRFHDYTRTIDINYLGPVRLMLELLPGMRERGSGHIVNVSTIGVIVPPAPRWSAYQASKAAFDVWLRSVGAEIRDDGITTSSLYLALVHTRMSAPTDDFRNVPGWGPERAGELVCHAIVERPRAVVPWWATAGSVIGDLARAPAEFAMSRYYQRTSDTASARGERG